MSLMEATSSSTLLGQQNLQQQQREAEPAGDEEGSNFSLDQVCQVQDPVTRNCKWWRSNSVTRLGDAAAPPPLAQVEDPSMVAAREAQTAFPSIWNEQFSMISNASVPSSVITDDPADSHPNAGRPLAWGRTRTRSARTLSAARKTAIESAQPKSVEKMQQNTGNLQMASASNDVRAADPTDLQQATHARFKDSSDNEAQGEDRGKPYLGSLQAMQAKILAEKGFQKGVQCSRRDSSKNKNWRCPLLATAGTTLCEHHKAMSRAKYARKKLQKRSLSTGQKIPELETGRFMQFTVMQPEITLQQPKLEENAATTQVEAEALANVQVNKSVPGSLKALHAKICAEKGDESGVQCVRKSRGKDDPRGHWQCPMNARKGHGFCDHHYFQRIVNKAAKRMRKAVAKGEGNSNVKNGSNNDVCWSGSHIQYHQVSAEVPDRSLLLKRNIEIPSQAVLDEKLDHTETPDMTDEISEDDRDDHADSDADQLLPHMLKNESKRWYVAPRKTADHANVKVNSHDRETSSGLILSPMISPQPAMNAGTGARKAQLFRSLLQSL